MALSISTLSFLPKTQKLGRGRKSGIDIGHETDQRNPTAAGGSKYLRDGGNRGSDEPKTQTARDLEIQGINCRGTTTINANDLEIQKRVELMAEIFKNPKLIF
ncbi:hypothetical protein JHK87_035109 [Glycine soja]|nr:hypothetical protein JHK87_035109 [Glycine soja]